MSLTAAAIKIMADKGLSAHDVAEIAAANEAAPVETAAERRRKWDRERKREQRLSGGKSTGNPPDPAPNDIDILTPTLSPVVSNETTAPSLKPEHVVEAWNATADRLGLPTVRKLTPERRRKLQTRIKQNTIDEFTEAIGAIERSPFLRGDNGRNWKADFDWMLEPKNFTKLTEGTYDR